MARGPPERATLSRVSPEFEVCKSRESEEARRSTAHCHQRGLAFAMAASLVAALSRTAPAAAQVPPRRLPDYRGRANPPPSAGEVLLSVPRVLLYPVHLVLEYGVRAPLGWTLTTIERHHLPQRIERLTRPLPGLRVLPTVAVDLGLVTSGGLYLAWDRALHPRNALRLRASTGGAGYWYAAFSDRVAFAPGSGVGIRVSYLERSDWRFHGLGPSSEQRDEQLFNWARGDAHLFIQYGMLRHAALEIATGLRYDHFGTPALADSLQTSLPGYSDRGVFYTGARAFVDSRDAPRPEMTGLRLDLRAQLQSELDAAVDRRWVNYELEGAAFLEVFRPGRVLSARALVAFADATSSAPVPFVDLVALGGFEAMRGWFPGRFRGQSAAVFTLGYRYPVWWGLDGDVHVEVGNVFGQHLAGFDLRLLHGSAGMGFRTIGNRDESFDVLFAVGSSRFDQPFAIESFRLAIGLNRGF